MIGCSSSDKPPGQSPKAQPSSAKSDALFAGGTGRMPGVTGGDEFAQYLTDPPT